MMLGKGSGTGTSRGRCRGQIAHAAGRSEASQSHQFEEPSSTTCKDSCLKGPDGPLAGLLLGKKRCRSLAEVTKQAPSGQPDTSSEGVALSAFASGFNSFCQDGKCRNLAEVMRSAPSGYHHDIGHLQLVSPVSRVAAEADTTDAAAPQQQESACNAHSASENAALIDAPSQELVNEDAGQCKRTRPDAGAAAAADECLKRPRTRQSSANPGPSPAGITEHHHGSGGKQQPERMVTGSGAVAQNVTEQDRGSGGIPRPGRQMTGSTLDAQIGAMCKAATATDALSKVPRGQMSQAQRSSPPSGHPTDSIGEVQHAQMGEMNSAAMGTDALHGPSLAQTTPAQLFSPPDGRPTGSIGEAHRQSAMVGNGGAEPEGVRKAGNLPVASAGEQIWQQKQQRPVGRRKSIPPALPLEDDVQGQRLLEALETFQNDCQQRTLFCEMDVATAMLPEKAVGRSIRVLWEDEDAWFLGTVASYDPVTGKHEVRYADGDIESLFLVAGCERIRLQISPGEVLEPPNAAQLHDYSQILLKAGRDLAASADEAEATSTALQACMMRLRFAADEAAKVEIAADGHPSGSQSSFAFGEVVWIREKGWPHWPSLVVTPEQAIAGGVKRMPKGGVCVQSFGTYTWTSMKATNVLPFAEGVRAGLHLRCDRPRFRTAIFDTTQYLKDGELPDEMTPDHNDEGFSEASDDEGEGEEEMQEQEKRQGKSPAASRQKQQNPVSGEIRCGDKLTVNCLGQINFTHPAFHNEKNLWPIGYRATRLHATPASGGKEAPHICEILAAPDGSGPLFRVTCGETVVESKHNPYAAWMQLYPADDPFRKRVSGGEGMLRFGLKKAQVLAAIQQLPHAARCDRFCAWTGEPPPVTPFTAEEMREREAAEIAMQQLPDGIRAITHPSQGEGLCEACGCEDESEDNLLLECDACRSFVHQDCYGILDRPEGAWLCDLCKTGTTAVPACVLCPGKGGALKRTSCGRWCHAACALWIPEAFINTDVDPSVVQGIGRIPKARRSLTCSLCKQQHGACIQCGHKACFTAFHPLCAYAAGLVMESQHDELYSDSDDSPVKHEGLTGAVNLTASCTGAAVAAPQKKGAGRRRWGEGTAIGDGTRLVCYCAKHPPQDASADVRRLSPTPQAPVCPQPVPQAPTTSAAGDADDPGCARGRPFDHALRRGLRAPETFAAAMAKRNFVRATPYQVTELPRRGNAGRALPEGRCIHTESGLLDVQRAAQPDVAQATVGVRTQSERYREMRATESKRVTSGKSAIHGWGALSKVDHAKGDMVIEYIGELVRPSVADVRERRLYDQMVGAGTYVFRLNEDTCVDATRAGNLAHMLNHSCEPNCYSRTISVYSPEGEMQDHVVIFAKENIPANTELTYNYRFLSSDRLPCNCGAASCCGLVNASGAPDQHEMAPRTQLRPWRKTLQIC